MRSKVDQGQQTYNDELNEWINKVINRREYPPLRVTREFAPSRAHTVSSLKYGNKSKIFTINWLRKPGICDHVKSVWGISAPFIDATRTLYLNLIYRYSPNPYPKGSDPNWYTAV